MYSIDVLKVRKMTPKAISEALPFEMKFKGKPVCICLAPERFDDVAKSECLREGNVFADILSRKT